MIGATLMVAVLIALAAWLVWEFWHPLVEQPPAPPGDVFDVAVERARIEAEMLDCPGSGGVVFLTEGPQFGPQWQANPCPLCGRWHERNPAAEAVEER